MDDAAAAAICCGAIGSCETDCDSLALGGTVDCCCCCCDFCCDTSEPVSMLCASETLSETVTRAEDDFNDD